MASDPSSSAPALKLTTFRDTVVDAVHLVPSAVITGGILYKFGLAAFLTTTMPVAAGSAAALGVGLVALEYFQMDKNTRSLKNLRARLRSRLPQYQEEFTRPELEALRPELEKYLADNGIPEKIKFINSENLPAMNRTRGGANAMTAGVMRMPDGEKRVIFAVSPALIERLNPAELKAFLAHEVGHEIVGRKPAYAMKALQFAGFSATANTPQWLGFSFDTLASFSTAFQFGVVSALITSSHRRAIEYRADRVGALLTRDPGALASSLRKIAFGTPLLPMFASHPVTQRRIERLEKLEKALAERGLLHSQTVRAPRAAAVPPKSAAPKASAPPRAAALKPEAPKSNPVPPNRPMPEAAYAFGGTGISYTIKYTRS